MTMDIVVSYLLISFSLSLNEIHIYQLCIFSNSIAFRISKLVMRISAAHI